MTTDVHGKEFDVEAFAKSRAGAVAAKTGESERIARTRLKRVVSAILDEMEDNEQQRFPLPSANGNRRVMLITKVTTGRFRIAMTREATASTRAAA